MQRKIVETQDGSSSIYVEGLGEHYHSHYGAVQESQHIFIDSALAQSKKTDICILEFGFGTGLNAYLAYEYAQKNNLKISYYTLEKYPLQKAEYLALNYGKNQNRDIFVKLHQAEWGTEYEISSFFSIQKIHDDFRAFKMLENKFDIVFFDAFAPDVQPHLWSEDIFRNIYASMTKSSVLTTYTVKGSIRRILKSIGFNVEKIPGPPGKREITRAWK